MIAKRDFVLRENYFHEKQSFLAVLTFFSLFFYVSMFEVYYSLLNIVILRKEAQNKSMLQ